MTNFAPKLVTKLVTKLATKLVTKLAKLATNLATNLATQITTHLLTTHLLTTHLLTTHLLTTHLLTTQQVVVILVHFFFCSNFGCSPSIVLDNYKLLKNNFFFQNVVAVWCMFFLKIHLPSFYLTLIVAYANTIASASQRVLLQAR